MVRGLSAICNDMYKVSSHGLYEASFKSLSGACVEFV